MSSPFLFSLLPHSTFAAAAMSSKEDKLLRPLSFGSDHMIWEEKDGKEVAIIN